VNDVFRKLEPAAHFMEELPIFWQGQFHQECQAALERSTGEIMSPVSRAIHQSGTLMEAVHLMNSGGIDWLPVVEGGDVVGILLKDDLFREVVAVAREGE
jgi:CBS domain-containing protein